MRFQTLLLSLLLVSHAIAQAPVQKIEGTVKNPDGSPAANVKVVTTGEKTGVPTLDNGAIKDTKDASITTTDAKGQFTGNRPEKYFMLSAVSDAGFGEVSWTQFDATHEIVIQPWARIEGEIRRGKDPDLDSTICLEDGGYYHDVRPRLRIGTHIKPDAQGRFVFEKVPSTFVRVGRMTERTTATDLGVLPSGRCSDSQTVFPKPSETLRFMIGGAGRPVVGKLVPPAGFENRIAYQGGDFVMLTSKGERKFIDSLSKNPEERSREVDKLWLSQEYRETVCRQKYLDVKVASDGTFRVDDVPPGEYDLTITVNFRDREPDSQSVGVAGREIVMPDVPGGYSPEALDLGELPIKIREEFNKPK